MDISSCSHREFDPFTAGGKACPEPASVICALCGHGTCADADHTYRRFCTLLPPGDPYTKGIKLFYWCRRCAGPLCVRCLGVQDDYPCPPSQVLAYPFACPGCQSRLQVVQVHEADFRGVSSQMQRWARTGGPSG